MGRARISRVSSVGTVRVSWEALGRVGGVWGLVWGLGVALGHAGLQKRRKGAVGGGTPLGAPRRLLVSWEASGHLGVVVIGRFVACWGAARRLSSGVLLDPVGGPLARIGVSWEALGHVGVVGGGFLAFGDCGNPVFWDLFGSSWRRPGGVPTLPRGSPRPLWHPSRAVSGASWGVLGPSWGSRAVWELALGPFGRHLGLSWGCLGVTGSSLGPSWGALGLSRGLLGPSEGPPGALLDRLGVIREAVGAVVGRSWSEMTGA